MPAYTLLNSNNELTNTVITCPESRIETLSNGSDWIEGAFPASEFSLNENGEPIELETKKIINTFKPIDQIFADLFNQGYAIDWGLPQEGEWSAENALLAIDLAAGRARTRVSSHGAYISDEYRLTQEQLKQWRQNGSSHDNIPPTLQSWIDANEWEPETAAQNIEQAAVEFENSMIQIRDLRLKGKAAVKQSDGNFADAASLFIEQLNNVHN